MDNTPATSKKIEPITHTAETISELGETQENIRIRAARDAAAAACIAPPTSETKARITATDDMWRQLRKMRGWQPHWKPNEIKFTHISKDWQIKIMNSLPQPAVK